MEKNRHASLTEASEQYKRASAICREVFTTGGRMFKEPEGIRAHLDKARELYTQARNEAAAVKEVNRAETWLIAIARKFLIGAVEYFEGRIAELSYMSIDKDIMDYMEGRLRDYRQAVQEENNGSFERRLTAYKELAEAVKGARAKQAQRNEQRARRSDEEASQKELARRLARRQREDAEQQSRDEAKQRQEQAEAQARQKRKQQFDDLFGE